MAPRATRIHRWVAESLSRSNQQLEAIAGRSLAYEIKALLVTARLNEFEPVAFIATICRRPWASVTFPSCCPRTSVKATSNDSYGSAPLHDAAQPGCQPRQESSVRFHLCVLVLLAGLSGCGEDRIGHAGVETAGATTTSSDSSGLSGLSLKQLYDRTQDLMAESRRLNADMQRDIDDTKRRLGSRVNDPSSNAEAERIRATWPPKIQAVDADLRATMEEIRKRCPGGAALNAMQQRCR